MLTTLGNVSRLLSRKGLRVKDLYSAIFPISRGEEMWSATVQRIYGVLVHLTKMWSRIPGPRESAIIKGDLIWAGTKMNYRDAVGYESAEHSRNASNGADIDPRNCGAVIGGNVMMGGGSSFPRRIST